MKKVSGISIASVRGKTGKTARVICSVTPEDASCPMVRWSSSDPTAAGVDADGLVTFRTPGSLAVITATSADGGFASVSVASTLLSASEPTVIAGEGVIGTEDGSGTAARFNGNQTVCVSGGNLYLTEINNNDIRCVDLTTKEVTRIAGNPGAAGSADGVGENATFSSPDGICSDGLNLYVADQGNNTIRKIEIATRTVSTLAGTVGVFGYTDGTGSAASFSTLRGLCTDGVNLYAASGVAIRKIVIQTGQVTTIWSPQGGNDSFAYLCTDGAFLYFNSVGASNANCIYKLDLSSGIASLVAGQIGNAQGIDEIGSLACFVQPNSLCTDGKYLYVADRISVDPVLFGIRKIEIATNAVGTIGTQLPFWIQSFSLSGGAFYISSDAQIVALALQ